MGKMVHEAHELLAGGGCEGQFKPWIEAECGISRSTAYNYMNARRRFSEVSSDFGHILIGFSSLEAMFTLTAPSARRKPSTRPRSCQRMAFEITEQRAKEILDKFREVRVKVEKKAVAAISEPAVPDVLPPDDALAPAATPENPLGIRIEHPDVDEAIVEFDPVALEAAPLAPVKPRKPGSATVGRKLREKAKKARRIGAAIE